MSGVRDTLQRLRARLGPGPRSFLAWWGQALATWLPARWRVLLGLTGDRLLFQRRDDEIEMTWLDGTRRQMLARLPVTVTSDELQSLCLATAWPDCRAGGMPFNYSTLALVPLY